MDSKSCSRCAQTKFLSEFPLDKGRPGSWCYQCRCEAQKAANLAKDYTVSVKEKTCSKCNQLLPESSFTRDRRRPDGLFPYCKDCRKKSKPEKRLLEQPAEEPSTKSLRHFLDNAEPKTCISCKETLSKAMFGAASHTPDRLKAQCKLCDNKIGLSRQKQQLSCSECDALFVHQCDLDNHMNYVHAPQPSCPVCNASFDCFGWRALHLHYSHGHELFDFQRKNLRVFFCHQHAGEKRKFCAQHERPPTTAGTPCAEKQQVVDSSIPPKEKTLKCNAEHPDSIKAAKKIYNARPDVIHAKAVYAKHRANTQSGKIGLRLAQFRYQQRKRELQCDISDDILKQHFLAPCFFCGTGTGQEAVHGICRLDTSLGYTPDNVVTACETCGYFKHDLTVVDFYDRVKLIHQRAVGVVPLASCEMVVPVGNIKKKQAYYRDKASKRGVGYSLSILEFKSLVCEKHCFYCTKSASPNQLHGVNRVDESKEFSASNCVTCCYPCNWMKRGGSVDDFFSNIAKIHFHMAAAGWPVTFSANLPTECEK